MEDEFMREIKTYFELNEAKWNELNELNENIIYQNVCYTEKAVLQGKFIQLNAYIRKEEKSN